MCISPSGGMDGLEFGYRISLLLIYEIVFSSTFYLKFIYTREVLHRAEHFDIIYMSEHFSWFVIGRIYSLGLILSLCNRAAHLHMIDLIGNLDRHIRLHLQIKLSFRQLNIEFIAMSVAITIYQFTDYLNEGIHNEDDSYSMIYYFCITVAANFFYIYALYMVYWARVFLNRADYIVDALRVAISQKYMSQDALSIIMESIKLLFDVRGALQNAFGSTLCIIVMANSFLIAVSTYGLIDNLQREDHSFYLWFKYLLWCLIFWVEFVYIVVFFHKIGDVVSR